MKEEYNQRALDLLKSFQVIEFSLKAYIVHSYNIIKYRVGGDVTFDYSYRDIRKQPLGALISSFAKLTDDKDLVRKLGEVSGKRNYIAHQAFMISEDKLADDLKDDFVELNLGLESIQLEVNECLERMLCNLDRHYLIEPQLKENAL